MNTTIKQKLHFFISTLNYQYTTKMFIKALISALQTETVQQVYKYRNCALKDCHCNDLRDGLIFFYRC